MVKQWKIRNGVLIVIKLGGAKRRKIEKIEDVDKIWLRRVRLWWPITEREGLEGNRVR